MEKKYILTEKQLVELHQMTGSRLGFETWIENYSITSLPSLQEEAYPKVEQEAVEFGTFCRIWDKNNPEKVMTTQQLRGLFIKEKGETK